MCISANAEENIKVYNNNEEVILSNELFLYEGEYFLNFNDLNKFGLDISRNDKVYSIISNDCYTAICWYNTCVTALNKYFTFCFY